MFLCASAPACLIACDTVKYGSWWLSKGTPAEVLYKGTITRIIGEDSPSRAEKVREDALPKGHVIYEGKKGHVLSYDGKSEPAASRAGAGGCATVLGCWEIFEARLTTCDGMTSQVHFQHGFSPIPTSPPCTWVSLCPVPSSRLGGGVAATQGRGAGCPWDMPHHERVPKVLGQGGAQRTYRMEASQVVWHKDLS